MKCRIVRRYSPISGNWWIIQRKILFFWIDSKLIFDSLNQAIKYKYDSDIFNNIFVNTVEINYNI